MRARILFMQTAALFILMLTKCAALIIALHFVTFINLILDTNNVWNVQNAALLLEIRKAVW